MGNLYHGNAKTTAVIRAEIQGSQASLAKLASKYGLNIKTVAKWRKAGRVSDAKPGPIKPKSALSDLEQAAICETRKKLRLSTDDLFTTLKPQIPSLTRSNLQRCLVRHECNVLEPLEDEKPREKKKFKAYPLGFVHMDITELRITTGKLYLFVAIDRTSKYVYVELHEQDLKILP